MTTKDLRIAFNRSTAASFITIIVTVLAAMLSGYWIAIALAITDVFIATHIIRMVHTGSEYTEHVLDDYEWFKPDDIHEKSHIWKLPWFWICLLSPLAVMLFISRTQMSLSATDSTALAMFSTVVNTLSIVLNMRLNDRLWSIYDAMDSAQRTWHLDNIPVDNLSDVQNEYLMFLQAIENWSSLKMRRLEIKKSPHP